MQIVAAGGVTEITRFGDTVTVIVVSPVQEPVVPVTVYVVVLTGEAITVAPVVIFKPVAFAQA